MIELPLRPESHKDPRLCTNCMNVMMGSRGLFCREYREDIIYDNEAEECDAYDPY